MLSGGSDQTTNILVYIPTPTHQSALQKKREKDRLKQQQQFTYTTHFSINFLFYFLLRLFISNLKFQFYHSTINLCTASMAAVTMTMQLFLKDNLTSFFLLLLLDSIFNKSRNILPIYRTWLHSLGTHSGVDLKRYSNISQVYQGWLHSLGTRSAVDLLKVFTTNLHIYE